MTVTTPSARTSSRPAWLTVSRGVVRWGVGPLATILVAAAVVFFLLAISPGDPVSALLGSKASEEQRQLLRERLGLDQPVVVQFGIWLSNAVQGDFGRSYTYRQDVAAILGPRIEVTFTLVVMAMILILVVGLALGLLGGLSRRFRPLANTLTGLMISVPNFVAASFLISVFAVGLGWFPTFGAGSPGLDRIWHLTLPAVALTIGWAAYLGQISIAAIGEVGEREHVTTAVGRGLPRALIVRKHVLRNAGVPVLAASGLTLAALAAGAIIVESAFAVDGIGSLLVRSVLSKDQPVVLAISLIVVVMFVAMTTIVDILQYVLDPTMRRGGPRR